MNVIQCALCKSLFQSVGGKICNGCLAELDDSFITVREYLEKNPNASMEKVVDKTGVPKRDIMHLLREGRLVMATSNMSGGMLYCEVCKRPISTGKMCSGCKSKLASTIEGSISGNKSSGSYKGPSTAKIGK